MPRFLQGNDGSKMRWLSPQSSAGFDKRSSGGILGGGTNWEMAAASLDIAEECHERASNCLRLRLSAGKL